MTMRITGRWTIGNIDALSLTGGAGSDFVGSLESAINQIDISITKTTDPIAHPWRMDIKRLDTIWAPGFRLYVRRTADGLGDGTIAGGTVYQEITEVDQSFFSGTGDRTKIELQLKLDGVQVANMHVESYSTTIYYTVTEL